LIPLALPHGLLLVPPVPEIAVILNPRARSERAQSLADELAELAPEADLRLTEKAGDARRLAADAAREGFRVVVAAGGDGTVNEVVNGLAGSETALGVLPLGTMNVFAKEHALPTALAEAWAVARAGVVRHLDLAAANDAHFIQLAGVGLDAQIVKETTWESKRALGPLSYLLSAAHVASRTPPRIIVESDARTCEGSFVLVGNGRYYGSKLIVFPEARPDDGLLDVLIFKNLGYLDIARYLGGIIVGRHTDLSDVEYFQAAEARVRSAEDVPVEVDGELSGTVPVRFRIAGKLGVCVPS
jgi:diacylglycerol kinase (ATP)